ncbi:MAG: MGMT family protein [Atribacterota bacterium]
MSWQNDKLVSFTLPRKKRETALLHFTQQCRFLSVFPHEEKNDPFKLEEPIQKYFEGQIVSFLPYPFLLDFYPPFTRKVLEETALIPYGTTRTYGEIARAVGTPRACRAVGQSLDKNLLPLFIPCHRVIAQNSLGGFGEGLHMKVLLLSIELSNFTSHFRS